MGDEFIIYPLKVRTKLWGEFKKAVPRRYNSINDKLVEMIEKEAKTE